MGVLRSTVEVESTGAYRTPVPRGRVGQAGPGRVGPRRARGGAQLPLPETLDPGKAIEPRIEAQDARDTLFLHDRDLDGVGAMRIIGRSDRCNRARSPRGPVGRHRLERNDEPPPGGPVAPTPRRSCVDPGRSAESRGARPLPGEPVIASSWRKSYLTHPDESKAAPWTASAPEVRRL